MQELSGEQMSRCFDYLEKLRESGVVNMFGASPFLMIEFNFDSDTAKHVLMSWMHKYDNTIII